MLHEETDRRPFFAHAVKNPARPSDKPGMRDIPSCCHPKDKSMRKLFFPLVLTAIAMLDGLPLTAAAAPPELAKTCTAERVYSVEAANLEFGRGTIAIKAEGMASTLGWKMPALRLLPASGDAGTLTYEFVGCRPAFGAEVMSPISAQTTIATNTDAVKRIVIEAKTNSQSLDVAEFKKTFHGNAVPADR